jgi:hypothetical protein
VGVDHEVHQLGETEAVQKRLYSTVGVRNNTKAALHFSQADKRIHRPLLYVGPEVVLKVHPAEGLAYLGLTRVGYAHAP